MDKKELQIKLSEESVLKLNGVQIEIMNDLLQVTCNGRVLYTDDQERAFERFLQEVENSEKIS